MAPVPHYEATVEELLSATLAARRFYLQVIGAYIPARRASRADPASSLRAD